MSRLWPTYLDRELPLSRAQRKAIHREAWRRWIRRPLNLLVYLTLPCGYVGLLTFVRDLVGEAALVVGIDGVGYHLARAAAITIWAFVCFVMGGAILQRWRFAPLAWQAAREHGCDLCTRCGYWLRELPEDVTQCPECGAARPSADATHPSSPPPAGEC
jgi:hypothetical protein